MQNPIFEINTIQEDSKYGKFEITPLPEGYADTLGTSLRRVLLSSMKGAVITSVKVSGARHQFSTLKGMKEDVLDFMLNLKKVRVDYNGDDPINASINAKGPGEVKAGDIVISGNAKIANPELVLANLSKDSKLDAKFIIESSYGYSPAKEGTTEVGVIPLDASFSPIERVNYKREETRVGRITNFDKLTLEIWTDGTISPRSAITESSKILVRYFDQIINPQKVEKKVSEVSTTTDDLGTVGNLSVEEIGLPTRVANALAKAGFDTVEKLVNAQAADLVKVRNLGEKSIDVVRDALKTKGIDMKNA
jgi:DNA-directed RNA polymerase subunit alpha